MCELFENAVKEFHVRENPFLRFQYNKSGKEF